MMMQASSLFSNQWRIFSLGVAMIGLCLLPHMAMAEDDPVRIVGGPDITGHNYEWKVYNNSPSPIVYIEFPHWHADLFYGQTGWSIKGTTYLVHVGVPDLAGVCKATAESPANYIRPGGSAIFTMRISPKGADRGKGQVKVRFADGSERIIDGVELPRQPPQEYKFATLIALAVLFVGFVIFKTLRQRRTQPV